MTRLGDVVTIQLAGELDVGSADRLSSTVAGAAQDATKVVLDLDEVVFVDSVGIGTLLLLKRRHRATGCEVAVVHANGHPAAVFEIMGVASLLDTDDSGPDGLRVTGADRSGGLATASPDDIGRLRVELEPATLRTTVVHVSGELDTATAGGLQACVRAVEPGSVTVVLDLRDVTFMDSSGVTAILVLHRELDAAARCLHLRNVIGQPRRLLERVCLEAHVVLI
jgi:anti-anti-sigma factor